MIGELLALQRENEKLRAELKNEEKINNDLSIEVLALEDTNSKLRSEIEEQKKEADFLFNLHFDQKKALTEERDRYRIALNDIANGHIIVRSDRVSESIANFARKVLKEYAQAVECPPMPEKKVSTGMDIYSKPGTKVRYLDQNGYDVDRTIARDCGLQKGEVYEVEHVDIGGWSSRVFLKGYSSGMGFNTVMFENVHDGRCSNSERKL